MLEVVVFLTFNVSPATILLLKVRQIKSFDAEDKNFVRRATITVQYLIIIHSIVTSTVVVCVLLSFAPLLSLYHYRYYFCLVVLPLGFHNYTVFSFAFTTVTFATSGARGLQLKSRTDQTHRCEWILSSLQHVRT